MMMLHALGIPTNKVEYKLPVSDHDRKKIDELMKRHGINGLESFIAINPVAKWETKLWSNQKFARLADELIDTYDAKILFTGGAGDRQTIQNIMSAMNSRAVNLAGDTTLNMLAALYEKMNLVVSTDTGPMHMAAAVGTPVVALFGPTAPWRTGPYGPAHQAIQAGLDCSPCLKRRCETMECMKTISVKQVLDATFSLLKKYRI
jgi:lipopolysaccharide heptosyltransferase II